MNHLYLVRHGENVANLTKEFSCRKVDYSLTPRGVLQAQQTAAYLADKRIDEIYSSPLKRAYETAQLIAQPHGLPVTILEPMREVNVGNLEGGPINDDTWAFHNSIIHGWFKGDPERRLPGGENYYELLARAKAGFCEILAGKSDRTMVVAGHGGIFSFTLRDLCTGADLDLVKHKEMRNCSITEIYAQVNQGKIEIELVRYADDSHMNGEAAQFVSGVPKVGEFSTRKTDYAQTTE